MDLPIGERKDDLTDERTWIFKFCEWWLEVTVVIFRLLQPLYTLGGEVRTGSTFIGFAPRRTAAPAHRDAHGRPRSPTL